jgi:hypothetical protein
MLRTDISLGLSQSCKVGDSVLVCFYNVTLWLKDQLIITFLYKKRYTGCRKINVFQVAGLVGKNLRNLEKIK